MTLLVRTFQGVALRYYICPRLLMPYGKSRILLDIFNNVDVLLNKVFCHTSGL